MSEETPQGWQAGLTAKAIEAATNKAASIDAHVSAGNKEYGKAALDLELVHRHYLKGDKARLTSYCESEVRGIKASMAYVYVQAGRVLRNPEAAGLTADTAATMAVQALAIFDRYLVPDDSEAQAQATEEAKALVTANVTEAKAQGTKALTAEGLRESVKALRSEADGEAPTDATDRKTGNIASKLRDELAKAIGEAEARRTEKGPLAGWYYLAKWCATNAQYGPVTPAAIDRLYIEAQAAKMQADKAQAKADREAAKMAADVDTLRPPVKAKATPKATPKVTEAPKAKAPKRTNRATKATGTAALVKANAPENGK